MTSLPLGAGLAVRPISGPRGDSSGPGAEADPVVIVSRRIDGDRWALFLPDPPPWLCDDAFIVLSSIQHLGAHLPEVDPAFEHVLVRDLVEDVDRLRAHGLPLRLVLFAMPPEAEHLIRARWGAFGV